MSSLISMNSSFCARSCFRADSNNSAIKLLIESKNYWLKLQSLRFSKSLSEGDGMESWNQLHQWRIWSLIFRNGKEDGREALLFTGIILTDINKSVTTISGPRKKTIKCQREADGMFAKVLLLWSFGKLGKMRRMIHWIKGVQRQQSERCYFWS